MSDKVQLVIKDKALLANKQQLFEAVFELVDELGACCMRSDLKGLSKLTNVILIIINQSESEE